jgi:glutamine synthetase
MSKSVKEQAKLSIFGHKTRKFEYPHDSNGRLLKISQFYGENVFRFDESANLTETDKKEIKAVISKTKPLSKDIAEKFANAVLRWAIDKGATHFTHWFQPLTGSSAEKHDSFLSIENGKPIEKLSASALMQGEPDASSFPHGGYRSTFEARGYTTWDLSSPIYLKTSENGKTLCIPTAFVSYHGDALDVKTPLLRSINTLGKSVSQFCNLVSGNKRESELVKGAFIALGVEQEYFLIDKGLFFERQDLVMTGRALFGAVTSRNQQLEDHYFGTIPDRVLAFMQEVEVELYKVGVPAKTRHNEVAPGQFEIAPIFAEVNVAADQNQIVMSVLKSVAEKHNFVCLLHEKPFAGINGSGKHCNWSVGDDKGNNLLEPTSNPHENYRFLASVSIICDAVYRHAGVLRAAIASHGNDHRLGANEAPPSIISVFLGETLTKILEAYSQGKPYMADGQKVLDLGTDHLAQLLKDNTDRNRTSPFAFTGNKFEFRAVGSSAAVGLPLSILNTVVADAFNEANDIIEKELKAGKQIDDILKDLIKLLYGRSQKIVFNGDGYSGEWVKEAEKRGLPNYRTTPDALTVLADKKQTEFLSRLGVLKENEVMARYNVTLERYIKHREIEFECFISMINKNVVPSALQYKQAVAESLKASKDAAADTTVEAEILRHVSSCLKDLYADMDVLSTNLEKYKASLNEQQLADKIAKELMPLSVKMAKTCGELEEIVPEDMWSLPTYYDLLFIK